MTRTAIQEAQRTTDGKVVSDAFKQIRSMVNGIRVKMSEMLVMRAKWAAGIESGAYDQADLDQLDELCSLWTAVPTTPLTMSQTADAFLSTQIGR